MRRRAYWFAMLACAACSDGGEVPEAIAEVVDSAGVTIVTSAPGDVVYAEMAEEPTLSFGALEGPEVFLFARIASVARDAEGNLIVADIGAGEIRVFGADGGHLRSFGGRGEGPGEFRVLVGAWPSAGGRIVAADRQLGRITEYDAMGALTGTATLSGVGEMSYLTPIGLAGPEIFLSRIRVLAMPSGVESPVQALEEAFEADMGPPEYFLRYRLDGALVDTLTQLPGPKMSSSTSGSGGAMRIELLRVPFSPEPSATGSVHGVAVTGGSDYEVSLFDEAGALSRIARLTEAPTIRTDEHLEGYVRSFGGRERDEAEVREMTAMYEELPLPSSLPAYTDLRFADTGELWARRYSERGAIALRWDIFGTDGGYRGRVEIPASFRIEEVSRGQLVGVFRDELDVQRVEVRDLSFVGR